VRAALSRSESTKSCPQHDDHEGSLANLDPVGRHHADDVDQQHEERRANDCGEQDFK